MIQPELLLELPDRRIYGLAATPGEPQAYFLADHQAGGVLINTSRYDPAVCQALTALAPLRFLFFPSRLGALDVDRWRAEGAESIAYGPEVGGIAGKIDIVIDSRSKLTRTIDFVPLPGRTAGTCALRLRNLPGVLFLGPVLAPGPSGWPILVRNADDHSFEDRVIGCLALKALKFEYAFTDRFVSGETRYGPGADRAIDAELERALAELE